MGLDCDLESIPHCRVILMLPFASGLPSYLFMDAFGTGILSVSTPINQRVG
jgi:hypothetical protein